MRYVVAALTLCLVLSYDLARAVVPVSTPCGDPNADATVAATDSLIALRTTVGLDTCLLFQCDVDNDADIESDDALDILRFGASIADAVINCPDPQIVFRAANTTGGLGAVTLNIDFTLGGVEVVDDCTSPFQFLASNFLGNGTAILSAVATPDVPMPTVMVTCPILVTGPIDPALINVVVTDAASGDGDVIPVTVEVEVLL